MSYADVDNYLSYTKSVCQFVQPPTSQLKSATSQVENWIGIGMYPDYDS